MQRRSARGCQVLPRVRAKTALTSHTDRDILIGTDYQREARCTRLHCTKADLSRKKARGDCFDEASTVTDNSQKQTDSSASMW